MSSRSVIRGIKEKVYFSAPGHYGTTVNIDVYDDDNGVYLIQGVPALEVSEPVSAYTGTIAGINTAGVTVVNVTDVTGLTPSDRVTIGSDIYRLTAVDTTNNQITIHRPLAVDTADLDPITRVGNMGIFRIDLLIVNLGTYLLQAKDSKFGIQMSESVTAIDKGITELIDQVTVEVNQNEALIKGTNAWTITL